MTRADIIANEIARLDKKHPEEGKHTEADAISEIVARACEDLLAQSKEAKAMFKSLPANEQKNLAEKIKDLIQKVIDWIDEFLATYVNQSKSKEAIALREMKEEFEAMQIMWDNMLRDVQKYNKSLENSATNEDASSDGGMKLAIREEFSNEIDTWKKEGMPSGETFILGTTGDVLQGLGAIESDIYMLSKKINEILKDHPEMTIDEIKKIPQILENPILILKSKNVGRGDADNTRLVIFGNIKAKDGRPILSVLDLKPVENHLAVDDMQKVSSAYTKDIKPVDFVKESLVVYTDKKRTTKLLRTIGFKAPIELQHSGYIGSISYTGQNVNIEGEEFSKVFKETSNTDTIGRTLSEGQMEYFKDSKVRDDNGNVIPLSERFNKQNNDIRYSDRDYSYDELIANAKYDNSKTPDYSHDWLDNNGKNNWDYWTVFIQEKNKTVWEATLNIANTANGEKILYDIKPIKKVEEGVKSPSTTTNSSIHNSDPNVNTKFSDRDTEYLELAKNPEQNEARLRELVDEVVEKVFSQSKVRGADGKLRMVYHGTVNDFTVFKRAFANIEADFGKSYYFTSNEYDVDANYANEEGPDLKNKIAHYAEQLERNDEYSDLSYEEREEIARQKFITSEPNTITAYLNMENPVYITPDENGTLLDFNEEYDEEYDEYSEPEGLLVDFIEALNDIAADYSYGDVDFNFLYEYAYDNGGVYASDAVKIIKHRNVDELIDDNGDLAINEVIRLAFEQTGFDGIIDTSVYYKFKNMNGMDSGTTHYIVFDSEQIKSADIATYDDNGNVIPLSERFNKQNNDIRYSDRDYSYDELIQKDDLEVTTLKPITPLEESKYKSDYDLFAKDMRNIASKKEIPKTLRRRHILL